MKTDQITHANWQLQNKLHNKTTKSCYFCKYAIFVSKPTTLTLVIPADVHFGILNISS